MTTLEDIARVLSRTEQRIVQVQRAIDIMEDYVAGELDTVKQRVEAAISAGDALQALVVGLAEQIRQNVTDQTALRRIADDLDQNTQEWRAAAEANTFPPEPNPPTV